MDLRGLQPIGIIVPWGQLSLVIFDEVYGWDLNTIHGESNLTALLDNIIMAASGMDSGGCHLS